MSDVMEEINDELRQQKLEAFWKENRNWIIGSIILAILTTAGLTWWRGWNLEKNLEATSALLKVADADDPATLRTFADTTRMNHAVLAKFLAAGLHVKQGNPDRAVEIYNEIAGESGLDRPLRDLARILSVGQRLNKDEPKKLHGELADLSGAKSPYRYTALEMDALVFAREGKMKEAADRLEDISTSHDAPDDGRMRATTLREFYAAAAGDASLKKDDKK